MSKDKKFSILIADNEETNLDLLLRILGDQYIVFPVKSGAAAIQKTVEYLPDLVLLDVVLSDINGLEVLSVLKEHEKTQKIPVIFTTGLNSADDEERGLRLGAADYVLKPFSPAIVNARVKTQVRILEQIQLIEEMGMLDSLTAIPNRRCFDSRFQAEWRRSLREKVPISLVLLDLDRFREYNEAHGRPQGDLILQSVAKLLEATIRRPTDLAACFGGEEFVVLLPNTDLNGALMIAEAIRNNVKSLRASVTGRSVGLTASVGITSVVPDKNASMDYFFAEAARLLRIAKSEGGDQIAS